jgi:uroporphyrinogen-III synthase
MSFHSLALRPEPGLAATLEKARAMGLAITGHALSEIRTAAWECPDPAGIDGLLIGSANAILHGGPHLARLTGKPVYAVGEATAAAARAAGFDVAMTGSGGLQGVLDAIHAPCHLLRIAGEEHVPLTPPEGVTFAEVIAYRSVMLRIDPVAALLASGEALVLLHSAATAAHFAEECDRLGVPRATVAIAALGPRIAAAAGPGWAGVHTSARPDEAALLQLVFDLCARPRSIPATPPRQP